jgi:hypothetical protein
MQLALERLGFNVWRDQTRLETNWSREIAQALAACDALCLLWSEQASRSRWVQHEWLTARALEKYIVPCFLSGEKNLPGPLENVHGLELHDLEVAIPILAQRLATQAGRRVHYEQAIGPHRTSIPYNPNSRFVGRDADMLDLYFLSIGGVNRTEVSRVGITGMGGIWKTQLAVEFCHRFGFVFSRRGNLDRRHRFEFLVVADCGLCPPYH